MHKTEVEGVCAGGARMDAAARPQMTRRLLASIPACGFWLRMSATAFSPQRC